MDAFSKKIESKFNSSFPQWAEYFGPAEYEGVTVFEARVPSPSNGQDSLLILDTFEQEVTVSFDSYHIHCDDFGNNNAYEDAQEFILRIISNEYAVVSYWREFKWCGSEIVAISNLPRDNSEYPYANIVKVRTWSGAQDKEITCVPRD